MSTDHIHDYSHLKSDGVQSCELSLDFQEQSTSESGDFAGSSVRSASLSIVALTPQAAVASNPIQCPFGTSPAVPFFLIGGREPGSLAAQTQKTQLRKFLSVLLVSHPEQL